MSGSRKKAAGASTEYVIISSDEQTVDDDAFRAYVGELQAALAAREDIVAAPPASYYDVAAESEEAAAGLVSASRTATLLPVEIVDDEAETVENLRDVLADHRSDDVHDPGRRSGDAVRRLLGDRGGRRPEG